MQAAAAAAGCIYLEGKQSLGHLQSGCHQGALAFQISAASVRRALRDEVYVRNELKSITAWFWHRVEDPSRLESPMQGSHF